MLKDHLFIINIIIVVIFIYLKTKNKNKNWNVRKFTIEAREDEEWEKKNDFQRVSTLGRVVVIFGETKRNL